MRPSFARVARRRSRLRALHRAVRVIDSGTDLADIVPDVSGAVVWTQDASAFYYVRLDQNHRPAGVFRHGVGTPVAADVRVFTEADPGFFISIDRHLSGLSLPQTQKG